MQSSIERILLREREEGYKEGFEIGRKEGLAIAKEMSAIATAETLKELGYSDELILDKIMEKFEMTREEALKYLK